MKDRLIAGHVRVRGPIGCDIYMGTQHVHRYGYDGRRRPEELVQEPKHQSGIFPFSVRRCKTLYLPRLQRVY